MSQPTIESVIEEKPIKHIIAEYVEKKDLYGLAEYFRAYIEDELAENEERKLCNSGRRMYQQGMKDERKRCVEIVERYIPKAESSYKSAVSDQVAPYRHRLEELLEIKAAINTK